MPDSVASPKIGSSPTSGSLWAACFFGLALLSIFYVTTWSMVSIWVRSETYAHGFLILPISLWLVWNHRDRLASVNSQPVLWVLALMIPVGSIWLLAYLVDVLVVQQLALITLLLVGFWAVLGHQLARSMVFPLLFLFLAVPMGDSLIPPLMEFTATSTVWLIQQTGIPVYREGLYFSLPSGNWSVVEACSGQRYLIASVTLGVLYAYLTYFSFRRRFLFVLASIIVPIFANAIRAYIIVMLGHMSGMTIATGVDHLIYGWVFFGLVMFLLFWLGSFFREDAGDSVVGENVRRVEDSSTADFSISKLITVTLLALLVAAVWPLLAYSVQSRSDVAPNLALVRLGVNSSWTSVRGPDGHWQPDAAVAGQVSAYYGQAEQTVGLFIQYRDASDINGEVVGSSTRFARDDDEFRVVTRDKVSLRLGGKAILADQALLAGGSRQLLAWSWYRVGGRYTSNNYIAKLSEAQGSLGLATAGSYRIIVVTPIAGSPEATQQILQSFLEAFEEKLNRALGPAIGPDQ